MGDVTRTPQQPGATTTGMTPAGDPGDDNRGVGFGTRERATRGTDRDLDRSGEPVNQGHGHPRDERGASHD